MIRVEEGITDKYYPFEVRNWYVKPSRFNKGYKILLNYGDKEYLWLAYDSESARQGITTNRYVVYGIFEAHNGEAPITLADLIMKPFYKSRIIGKFKSLDSIMTKLYTDYGDLTDDAIEEIERQVIDV